MIEAIRAILGLSSPPGGPMPLMARSSRWPIVRAAHLMREGECRCCLAVDDLEVHHIEPIHVNPARELDPTNLLTLCNRCHLFAGHLGRWASWNVDVRNDCMLWRAKIKRRP